MLFMFGGLNIQRLKELVYHVVYLHKNLQFVFTKLQVSFDLIVFMIKSIKYCTYGENSLDIIYMKSVLSELSVEFNKY